MRNLRVWYGPLPEVVCIAQIKMTQAVLTFAIVAVVMIIITRFVFICVWKSMRSMDDNLLKRIALNEIILLVFLHSWCWPQSNSPSSEVCTVSVAKNGQLSKRKQFGPPDRTRGQILGMGRSSPKLLCLNNVKICR